MIDYQLTDDDAYAQTNALPVPLPPALQNTDLSRESAENNSKQKKQENLLISYAKPAQTKTNQITTKKQKSQQARKNNNTHKIRLRCAQTVVTDFG